MNNPMWVILTVDAENLNTPLKAKRYKDNLLTIETIKPILNIFDSFNAKAVFFLSVFEHCLFSKGSLHEVAHYLFSEGHDVQLHTHPYWCYGREHMWQFSLNDQVEIIKNGKQLIKEFIGRDPIAHRAGAYGLNSNTIEALRQNDIKIDSSMYYKHPNCHITWSKNQIIQKDGIVEIPVTGFYRDYRLNLKLFKPRYKRKFIKTDPDWCSIDELVRFFALAPQKNIKLVNFFMHSYSALQFSAGYKKIIPNEVWIDNLQRLLGIICNNADIEFITISKFWEIYQQDPELFSGSDHVPNI